MKKTVLFLIGLLLSFSITYAQKIGYINTETVLAQIPEYVSAQQQLEKLGAQYKTAIENESSKVDAAYKKYQADRASLREGDRKQRESQIIEMERAVKERKKTYFGEDGLMAKKSNEMMDPIKKKLNEAIDALAKEGGYSLILDISQLKSAVMYKNDSEDLSIKVIEKLK